MWLSHFSKSFVRSVASNSRPVSTFHQNQLNNYKRQLFSKFSATNSFLTLKLANNQFQLAERFCSNSEKNQSSTPKLSITYTCKVCTTRQVSISFMLCMFY